ncbi:MAG: hypothetical protein ACW98X_13710 [Promethearchaeota archaeon]|jgi:hypothetical protein
MVQVYEEPEFEESVEQEEVFVVIPEKVIIEVKKEELKPQKTSKLFKRNKKPIDINKVKNSIDTKLYTNRFVMR